MQIYLLFFAKQTLGYLSTAGQDDSFMVHKFHSSYLYKNPNPSHLNSSQKENPRSLFFRCCCICPPPYKQMSFLRSFLFRFFFSFEANTNLFRSFFLFLNQIWQHLWQRKYCITKAFLKNIYVFNLCNAIALGLVYLKCSTAKVNDAFAYFSIHKTGITQIIIWNLK